jgi:LmbE family N-acetylglucosaminyl deacetylase
MNNVLLLIPHQDDELFCYALLNKVSKVVIVFKGGGEPKGYTLDSEDLYRRRCDESLKTCNSFGINDVRFLGVQRPYTSLELDTVIKKLFLHNECDTVITTMEEDKHQDHKALSIAVKKHCTVELYGFIVQTNVLDDYTRLVEPDVSIKLSNKEFERKIKLADNYKTQEHFLPTVMRRKAYKWERYWRLK